jgi:hypothetical protein
MIAATATYMGLRTCRYRPPTTSCSVGATGAGVPTPSTTKRTKAWTSTNRPAAIRAAPSTRSAGGVRWASHPVSHHGIRPAVTPGARAKKAALPAAAIALRVRRRARDQEPTAAGAAGWATPIMASRVTSAASSSSLIPSVPDGRRGITR